MTETTIALDERRSASVQPGDLTAQLLACREKAGLDMEQAAKEMHLSLNILRALEKEDFAHLPEPPYVRGYLRSYAKLASKDPKELIHLYEQLRGAEPDAVEQHFAPAKPLNKVAQPALSSSTIKFILFGSVILLLGLISMIPGVRDWASSQWRDFSAQTNAPEVPRPAAALSTFTAQKQAEEKAAQDAIAQKQAEEKAAQDAQARKEAEAKTAAAQLTDTTTTTAATPSTAATTSTTTPSTASATPAAANTQTGMAATTADATATGTTPSTIASTDPNATPPTTTAPINGEVNVKMEFSEEVWVQIKDDNKKTIFESLNSPSSTKEFKATTPLNFKIGNANGVKIYLNGQPYDQAPYIKGSVARFKVE